MPVKGSLKEFADKSPNRNECIKLAYVSGQFSLAEIGEYFGLHYSWISHIVKGNDFEKAKLDPVDRAVDRVDLGVNRSRLILFVYQSSLTSLNLKPQMNTINHGLFI